MAKVTLYVNGEKTFQSINHSTEVFDSTFYQLNGERGQIHNATMGSGTTQIGKITITNEETLRCGNCQIPVYATLVHDTQWGVGKYKFAILDKSEVDAYLKTEIITKKFVV